ncbi:MAG TPA: PQQ-binding-like beta-propeller repeat protein [Candidatus Limnocylindrales bacterium]
MHGQHHRLGGARAQRRSLISTLAVVALVAAAGCGSSTPSAQTGSAAAPAVPVASTPVAQTTSRPVGGGDWAGFRGDPSRTAIGLEGPIGHPVLNWRFAAGGGVPNNIAIAGDTVYFASDDAVVHAVSRTSGAETWKAKLDRPTVRGPLAADGRLYLADENGTILAIDPSKAGAPLWQSARKYPATTEMMSVDGSLFFGTGDGLVVALDATSGAERWTVKAAPNGHAVHNPAFADGYLFAGTAGAGFVAVDVAAHKVAWTGDLHGDDTGTASAANGIAYIATPADATKGTLHAFDARTGKELWTGPSPMLTTPNVIDGVAYTSTMAGLVDALDASTGALRWSVQLSGKIRPMAVVGTTLYLSADTEQRVYAIEATTGRKLWQFDVDGPSDCCIAVAKGSVFVGTLNGSVYSIGGDGAQIAAVPFEESASVAPSGPAEPAAIAALATKLRWTADLRGKGFHPVCQIAVDPAGRIWAPEADGNKLAIYTPDGKLVEEWGSPGAGPGQFDFTRANDDGYGTLAFANDSSFFVLDVGNRRVQHFDARRTFVGQWGTFGSKPGQFNDPVGIAVASDGSVWVLDDQRSVVEHYDRTGKVLGSFDPFAKWPANEGANSLTIDAKGNLYVSMVSPSQVVVFDSAGTQLRVVGAGLFHDQAGNMSVDAAGRLFVAQGPERGSAPGVLVFGPDGKPIGGFAPLGDGDGELVFPGGIALNGKGGVYVEDSIPESARLVRFELPAGVR